MTSQENEPQAIENFFIFKSLYFFNRTEEEEVETIMHECI